MPLHCLLRIDTRNQDLKFANSRNRFLFFLTIYVYLFIRKEKLFQIKFGISSRIFFPFWNANSFRRKVNRKLSRNKYEMLKRFKMHYTTKNVVYRGISNGMFRLFCFVPEFKIKLPFHGKHWRVTSIPYKYEMHRYDYRKYVNLAIIFRVLILSLSNQQINFILI